MKYHLPSSMRRKQDFDGVGWSTSDWCEYLNRECVDNRKMIDQSLCGNFVSAARGAHLARTWHLKL
jgi:hypothetical protein